MPAQEPPTPRLSPEQLAPAWQHVPPIMPWLGLLELQGWHLEEELRNRGWGKSGTPHLCQEGHRWLVASRLLNTGGLELGAARAGQGVIVLPHAWTRALKITCH